MSGWFKRFRVAAVGLGLSVVLTSATGCAGFFVYPGSLNGGSSSSGNYVYVANSTLGSNTTIGSLAGFTVGTGTLTAVANSPYTLSFVPTAVAVNPANTVVFVGSIGGIYAFPIDSGGALGSGLQVNTIANVVSMDVSPDGNWLIALDGGGGSVGAATIDEFQITSNTGSLAQYTSTIYTASTSAFVPRAIKFAPNGTLLCAALGTAGDLVYTFTSSTSGTLSGTLTSPQLIAAPASPMSDNGLAWSPNSTTLYIARSNSTVAGEIAEYSVTNGIPSSTFIFATSGVQPTSVAVNAAGTDVYVGNQSDGTISGYSVAASGTLASLGTAYASGPSVDGLAMDRTGDYLLAVARGGPPDLWMYGFDSTTAGKLDLNTTIASGADPAGPVALAMTH